MEKSIENIWQKGFIQNEALVVPKLTNIYNQKSIGLVAKYQRMFRINLIAIVIGSLIFLGITYLLKVPVAGFIIFCALNMLVVIGYQQLQKLKELDLKETSLEYLKSFKNWLVRNMNMYANAYQIFYPVFFPTFAIGMALAHIPGLEEGSMYARYIEGHFSFEVLGLPFIPMLALVVLSVVSFVFAKPIYKMDVESIYGPINKKLNNLISEMELLNQG